MTCKENGKVIPVTGRGALWDYEKSRYPHCLNKRLKDDDEAVSLTRRPRFIPQEDSLYSFLLEAKSNPGI
jgi:hypothetical protein